MAGKHYTAVESVLVVAGLNLLGAVHLGETLKKGWYKLLEAIFITHSLHQSYIVTP